MESNQTDANASSIPLTESSPSQQNKTTTTERTTEIISDDMTKIVENNVIAVFVARFDVLHGNTIEWQYPKEIDLDGIEYQAICSGHHNIRSDIIYFTKPPYFGVSVFRKVDNAEEGQRGACMRSVGVIVEPNENTGPNAKVWIHGHALNLLAQTLDFETDRSESIYKHLYTYFKEYRLQHRGITRNLWNPPTAALKAFRPATLLYYNYSTIPFTQHNFFEQLISVESSSSLEVVPRLDAFPFFVAQMGPQIFVLWKAALLKKRILFMTRPPLERACGYVYNTFLLGELPKLSTFKKDRKLHPKYAIGVNDIADLYDFSDGYVACTSDTIFESKTDLYDLLIDLTSKENEKPKSWYEFTESTPRIKSTSEISEQHNAADFHRFRSVIRQIFDTAYDMGFGQENHALNDQLDNALDSKANCSDAVKTALFQFILWYYRPSLHSVPEGPSQQQQQQTSSSSWQRLFGGATTKSSKQNRRKRLQEDVSMDPEEQEALLLGHGDDLADEEMDATEINNNDVFDAVAARVSEDHNSVNDPLSVNSDNEQRQEGEQASVPDTRKWGVHEKLTAALVGFFHVLSYQTLLTLENLLSLNDQTGDPNETIVLSCQDMIQLGLHPMEDILFVQELALLYFEKSVQVANTCQNGYCNSCCNKEVHGSIRI
ncbi:hypothetical protein INT45_002887 [Circinella minor]|uniref:UDENN domain-containing protein n=1 Tax=Circinella minor TaxID=1195481 RepID=A0A8H7S7X5_9FUNG|nr:hypothetical protein INT45_002887 [Circinella minor]